MSLISPSVNPNLSSDSVENVVLTVGLFSPEKKSALAICITPVTYAICMLLLLFSVDEKKPLMKDMIFC